VIPAATFLPFIFDAPETVHALGRFTIHNSATSGLHALGINDLRTPTWDRPVQLVVGLLLAALAVRLGRWQAVPAVALGFRLLIDPGTHHYYTAGMAAAVLVWELREHPARVPWRTMATVVLLELTANLAAFGQWSGLIRFALLAALIIEPFAVSRLRPTGPISTTTQLEPV
jgi:hypothetical protein